MVVRIIISALMVWILGLQVLQAQATKEFTAEKQKIKVTVPESWKSEGVKTEDGDRLDLFNSDKSTTLSLLLSSDAEKSKEDLFGNAMSQMAFKVKGKVKQESINGIAFLSAEGTGRFKNQACGIIIFAGEYKGRKYLCFISTETSNFDARKDSMREILESLTPME